MADGTRLKELQEFQRKTELVLMDEKAKRQTSEDQLHTRPDQINEAHEGLQATVMNIEHSMGAMQQQLKKRGSSSRITALHPPSEENPTQYNAIHRMEFPLYNGEEAKIWIRRCNRYFQIISIPEEQKVPLASVYMQVLEAHMLIFNKNLDEAFFMMKFISGLKEEIKGEENPQPRRFLIEAEVRARKEKNLCYKCDEPYTPGHRCKYRQVHMLMTEEEAKAYEDGEEQIEESPEDEDATVSFRAMGGNNSNKTLRINGKVNGKDIHILIDSGSTHCFIDEKVVQVLGCKLEQTTSMAVRIADGGRVMSKFFYPTFC
ncbi:UNVERIFIED_CONTAM: hypothetical protein Scaly_2181300 [Sesamum calycinum]|uniref:Retrotransposon gag protein n=1 Tax=Sesamum calycinum TaxID=2727403 RepID=A0AAW2MQG3_9LAMI